MLCCSTGAEFLSLNIVCWGRPPVVLLATDPASASVRVALHGLNRQRRACGGGAESRRPHGIDAGERAGGVVARDARRIQNYLRPSAARRPVAAGRGASEANLEMELARAARERLDTHARRGFGPASQNRIKRKYPFTDSRHVPQSGRTPKPRHSPGWQRLRCLARLLRCRKSCPQC